MGLNRKRGGCDGVVLPARPHYCPSNSTLLSPSFPRSPLIDQVAAVSCGVCKGVPVLDLEYEEDSNAEADANFVLTGNGDIVEIQATGEKRGFTRAEFEALFGLAEKGIGELFALQRAAIPAA